VRKAIQLVLKTCFLMYIYICRQVIPSGLSITLFEKNYIYRYRCRKPLF